MTYQTKGIPSKKEYQKNKEAKDYYKMGREVAISEIQKDSADAKQAVADMYSALMIAQAKSLLNTTLIDIYRILGQVQGQGALLQGMLNQLVQNPPPSLSNLVGQPQLQPPPLPVEKQESLNNLGIPPLPVGNEGGGGMGGPQQPPQGLAGGLPPTAGAGAPPAGGPMGGGMAGGGLPL
ncbi:hypothetical protein [Caldisericum sp.]|uniref:hypothetical protein n=1 Tax=Caldisericum sp. TaxID=2499687 RepID=UPI003D0CC71A